MDVTSANRAPLEWTWSERLQRAIRSNGLWQDLRYGCRTLASNPGFTVIAVLSLAIGIGANVAAFSWADALLLRPLTVARPGEVLTVGSKMSVEGFDRLSASYREYLDIHDRSRTFGGLAAFTNLTTGLTPRRDALPKLTLGMLVSGNFFRVMGVEPALGRIFRPEEDEVPGRNPVVVLSHSLWRQQFEGDPSILGRRLYLSGIEFTVIGVAPESFTGMNQFVRSDFFVPLMMWPKLMGDAKIQPLEARDFRNITIKGRLPAGTTIEQAQSELSAVGADLARAHPDTNKSREFVVQTELQTRIAQSPPDAALIAMLTTLAAAVLFVACANVAGLLTSRAPARAREMAMRVALGAGRGRLVRQLLTESLLIAVAGGALGIGVGYGGIRMFQQIQLPTDLPIALAFQLDRRALLFSLAVAVASALLFGLMPALQTSRTDLTAVMKSGDAVAPGRRRRWGRNLLVGAQVAVSVVLLALATFMYRGFQRQIGSGPGYRTDHLLMMSLDPSLVRYTEAQSGRFYEQLVDRTRSVPGVKSAALASSVPMATDGINVAALVPEGFQLPAGKENLAIFSARVDEHYFATMGIPLASGRGFRADDSPTAPRVAVVNEHFGRKYWPGQDAVGKRFRLIDRGTPSWVEIVGIAKAGKYLWLGEPPTEFVYLPYRQHPQQQMVLLTESAGDPASLTGPIRDVVRGLDSNQPMFNVRTMEEFYQMRTLTIFNVIIGTIGSMGAMGLGLAITGLYGLVAYAVGRRTKEIGIRMAIGAGRATVLRMVLRQGMLLAVSGLFAGLAGAVGAQQWLQATFPNGDTGFRPGALLIVAPMVLAVTFIASYIPAHRASRLDPMKALRHD